MIDFVRAALKGAFYALAIKAQINKAPGGFPPRALVGAGDEIRTHDFNLGKRLIVASPP